MDNRGNQNRAFLFLQGPHGPFFAHLAKMLNATGAACFKVGFNRGDQFFLVQRKDIYPVSRHDRGMAKSNLMTMIQNDQQ